MKRINCVKNSRILAKQILFLALPFSKNPCLRIKNDGIYKKWMHHIIALFQVSPFRQSELKNIYVSANGIEKIGWRTFILSFSSSKYCNRIFSRTQRDKEGQDSWFKNKFHVVAFTMNDIFTIECRRCCKSPGLRYITYRFLFRNITLITLLPISFQNFISNSQVQKRVKIETFLLSEKTFFHNFGR